MPFGYSDKIFPYPAVQYIPINLYEERIIDDWSYPFNEEIKLYISSNPAVITKLLDKYHFHSQKINNLASNELLIILLNGSINEIKYRGHKVTMVGTYNKNLAHIFKIKNGYFYKQKLNFVIYNAEGKELASKRFNLP
ncbi:MAG: hypothetical protein AWU54_731 [Candidatus Frackibacter sp. T328-2]|nr:MAG: hypothetical protein AWU54_731 [Candidatus Frackibacter sp. T328-2]